MSFCTANVLRTFVFPVLPCHSAGTGGSVFCDDVAGQAVVTNDPLRTHARAVVGREGRGPLGAADLGKVAREEMDPILDDRSAQREAGVPGAVFVFPLAEELRRSHVPRDPLPGAADI